MGSNDLAIPGTHNNCLIFREFAEGVITVKISNLSFNLIDDSGLFCVSTFNTSGRNTAQLIRASDFFDLFFRVLPQCFTDDFFPVALRTLQWEKVK